MADPLTRQALRKQHASIRAELPQAFRQWFTDDRQREEQLWRDYLNDPTAAHHGALVEYFLPLVRALAVRSKWRLGDRLDELDVVIADGCVGLLRVIEQIAERGVGADRNTWMHYIRSAVRRSFLFEHRSRTWGAGAQSEDTKLMRRFQRRFTRDYGRVPTSREQHTFIGSLITNPQIEIESLRRSMKCVPDFSASPRPAHGQAAPCGVDRPLLDREVMKLAMKNLRGVDRTIFKMAFNGHSGSEIAAKVGLHHDAVRTRLNGVLWEARKRADLAKYFELEPSALDRPAAFRRDPFSLRRHRTDEEIESMVRRGLGTHAICDLTIGGAAATRERVYAAIDRLGGDFTKIAM